jgi:hypothetical protein
MADQDLRAALERSVTAFESAGLDDDVKAAKARLAELDKAEAPVEEKVAEPNEEPTKTRKTKKE